MLAFKEFQEKAAYLPLDQQKEAYKWYIEGCKQGFYEKQSECSVSIYFYKAQEKLKEIENAETEEN